MYLRSIRFFGWDVLASNTKRSVARVFSRRESIITHSIGNYQGLDICRDRVNLECLKYFCTSSTQGRPHLEGSTHDVLFKKLASDLLGCEDDEVWRVFSKFMSSYGFPSASTISKLISGLSYSLDNRSLPKACNLVFRIARENSTSLEKESLSRLCLSLGRANMYIPASKVLRLMLHKNIAPTMEILCSVIMHMVKTEAGTHLASNILLEFCDHFHHHSAKKSDCALAMKPSTAAFNIVLEACVRYGSSLKGECIIEAMARIGVLADVHSVLLFFHIYEMNGQRDELKKFKQYVDRVSVPLAQNYDKFYDKLFSLHLKFDDIDSIASLVADVYFLWVSRPLVHNKDLMKPSLVPISPPYLKEGLQVQVMFELLQKETVFHLKGEGDFIRFKNGRIILTPKGLALIIVRYKRSGRINELSELLAAIEKEMIASEEGSLCCDVIHACVFSGLLETAHDILDDMELANIPLPNCTYMLLLNAYCREKMPKEAEALARQIKRAGLLIDASDELTVCKCLSGVAHENNASMFVPTTSRQTELTSYLLLEIREEERASSRIYELNSCISFFLKAKMLEDARGVYRKLQRINIQPTVQTYAYLIKVYSSLENYREITILWGDIKRYIARGSLLANRDLYELLVINFLRGGYFERVLEVIGLIKDHGMYADRWVYKHEFSRFHKNLYRSLKAADARTEAQRLRIEHVKAFRKWVRNN